MNPITRFLAVVLTLATLCLSQGQNSLSVGLVAHYPLDENANDSAGGNNGTVNGAVPGNDRFGNPTGAYFFDGVDDFIQIPPSSAAFGSQDYSISLWFKSLNLPNISVPQEAARFLVSKGGNNFELHLGSATSSTGMKFLPRPASGFDWNTPPAIYETNLWNHVIATFQRASTNVTLFINGSAIVLTGPAITNSPSSDNTSPARLGMRTNGSLPFFGLMDDVRIYDRALSSHEAQQLYQTESAPAVSLIKAVKPSFANLTIGKSYQLQLSPDLVAWTDEGDPFTATETSMVYPKYWDVEWSGLYFRVQLVQ